MMLVILKESIGKELIVMLLSRDVKNAKNRQNEE